MATAVRSTARWSSGFQMSKSTPSRLSISPCASVAQSMRPPEDVVAAEPDVLDGVEATDETEVLVHEAQPDP